MLSFATRRVLWVPSRSYHSTQLARWGGRANPEPADAGAVVAAKAVDLATSPSSSPSVSPLEPVKMRAARPSRRSLAHVKQTPLFPGGYRHVSKFEGEHIYNYGKHTFTIAKESVAMALIPAGCALGFAFTNLPSLPPLPWEVQVAYLALLFLASRLTAAGRANKLTKDLRGRHVVVTGGTSGIGLCTAAQLAGMGANVTIVATDSPHAAQALAYIKSFVKPHADDGKDLSNGEEQTVELQTLDLADFIAVREFCKRARQRDVPIDILVNNAGVLQQHHVKTRFGDDVQLAVNFLGPYLLTEGLLPLVQAAHGRIVNVACSAHVGVRGRVVGTYLSGRGVWSPRVADKFDGLEQYAFTKLGLIYHAQELALRSYPDLARASATARLTGQGSRRAQAQRATKAQSGSPAEEGVGPEGAPLYTTCACSPGGVLTRIYRHVPLSFLADYGYYVFALMMRTAWEGSQVVVNCCVRDEIKNGGYYMNTVYQPSGLSATACNVEERRQTMEWTLNKMKSYMKWE